MNHDRAKTLLPAYADRWIGPVRRFFLHRHIAGCPSCLAELEAIQAMRTTLRTNLPVHRAPPSLAMRTSCCTERRLKAATGRGAWTAASIPAPGSAE